MNLQKAIDRNVELKAELIKEGRLEKAEALQLGIEAIDRILYFRDHPISITNTALPSETKQ